MALNTTRNLKSLAESGTNQLEMLKEDIQNYNVKWHEKFTLSFIIIILFLIAAPLGTIIRKGGLGMPLVVSTLMYIFYHIINMIGIKMGREGVLPEWLGAWVASIILLPVGLFILYKASKESAIFDKEKYQKMIEKLIHYFVGKKDKNKASS